MSHIDAERFAKVFKYGDPELGIEKGNMRQSMLQAGYSENVAIQGRAKLSVECLTALMDEGIKLGRKVSPEDRGAWVRGKLLQNTIDGKDVAVKSLELLGKDKEVQMFTPDSQVGVIILQAPQELNVAAQIVEPPVVGGPVDLVEG